MKIKNIVMTAVFLSAVLVLGLSSDVYAQGGGANPQNGAQNTSSGRGTAAVSSMGNRETSDRDASNERNDNTIRVLKGGLRTMPDDKELKRYDVIAAKLETTSEALRAQFQTAIRTNPDLTWSQFVTASVIANNLHPKNSDISTADLLAGLQKGDSIGKTLRSLGLSSDEAKQAEKDAKQQIKESRKN